MQTGSGCDSKCSVFLARLASFGQLSLIGDPHIYFQHHGMGDQKGPENINHIIVKYGETIYGRHTALTSLVKMNRF